MKRNASVRCYVRTRPHEKAVRRACIEKTGPVVGWNVHVTAIMVVGFGRMVGEAGEKRQGGKESSVD